MRGVVHDHQAAAARTLARAAASLALAGSLAVLGGCGSGASGGSIVIGPGPGVPVGNLACTSVLDPAGNEFVQGTVLTVTFTLTDVNINVAGANIPISFEVVGGSLPNPPPATDAAGVAVVTFVSDPTFLGEARVSLIEPVQRLRCDVAFTIRKPACVLEAQVLAANGVTIIDAFDACGSLEVGLERHVGRRVRYRVTRLDPVTGVVGPLAGAFLQLTGEGMNFSSLVVGPTSAAGIIEAGDTDGDGGVDVPVGPFESGARTATLSASVIIPDDNGDGSADAFACNACSVSWGIIDPICDANGTMVAPTYRTAGGGPSAAPLRPGESATVTASFVIDGVPLAGFPVVASSGNGNINGSADPITVFTNGAGLVTVTYRPDVGFAGPDVVTLEADDENTTCTVTSIVEVVTCAIEATFSAPPTSGVPTMATLTLTGVDPMTALGETVSLDAIGGAITPQPPTRTVMNLGGGIGVTTTFTPSLGYSGPGSLSMSFISGYDCPTVSDGFVIAP